MWDWLWHGGSQRRLLHFTINYLSKLPGQLPELPGCGKYTAATCSADTDTIAFIDGFCLGVASLCISWLTTEAYIQCLQSGAP